MSDDQHEITKASQRVEVAPGQWSYPDGSIRDQRGRIVPGGRQPAVRNRVITPEVAHKMHAARKEKAMREVRARVREKVAAWAEKHGEKEEVLVGLRRSSAEAFGYAAGLLFDQIVLNVASYDRDRLQAFRDISRAAGLDWDGSVGSAGSDGAGGDLPRELVEQLRDFIMARLAGSVGSVGLVGSVADQVIDGEVRADQADDQD